MKKSISISIIAITATIGIFLSGFVLSGKQDDSKTSVSKEEALYIIKEVKKKSTCHIGAIKQIEKYARVSSCNFRNFIVYAMKASNCGCHTMLYVSLAEETSKLTTENPLLIKVADIVELPVIGIDIFDEILTAAIDAETPEEIAAVTEKINNLTGQY